MRLDDELGRFDWSRIQTYAGYAEMVPDAVRRLITAAAGQSATSSGELIEEVLLSVAGPCEGCAPVATVLVAALPDMTPAGHTGALQLLSLIGAAEITGPAHEQIGAVDVDEIRRAVAGGFAHFAEVLRTASSTDVDLSSCVELMAIAVFHDPSLAPEAMAALRTIRTGDRATALARLMYATLDNLFDLTTASPRSSAE